MVIAVSQHKLIKIRKPNRQYITRLAFYCSVGAFLTNAIASWTNTWLYTSEVLKYYVFPNSSHNFDDQLIQPVYFKNASFGPWLFCWLDPVTDFHCHSVDYFSDEDPSDVTTSVQQSIRKAYLFMLLGMLLVVAGTILSLFCVLLPNPYSSLFISSITHILTGIANFLCIIVFMSAVSKEVGNKIYPASEMDDPLVYFNYGYSLLFIKASFLLTESAALFTVVVFMAKRDERTYNRYMLRSLISAHVKAAACVDAKEALEARSSICSSNTKSAAPIRFQHKRAVQLTDDVDQLKSGLLCRDEPSLTRKPSLDTLTRPVSTPHTPVVLPRLRDLIGSPGVARAESVWLWRTVVVAPIEEELSDRPPVPVHRPSLPASRLMSSDQRPSLPMSKLIPPSERPSHPTAKPPVPMARHSRDILL